MESIEKLRTAARNMAKGRNLENHEKCNLLLIIADEIEREIAERYVELPVDADGVPIRVGDKMQYHGGEPFIVCAVAPCVIHTWAAVKLGERMTTCDYEPLQCTHYKPRTIEDVLEDFGIECDEQYPIRPRAELIAEYSAELRELLGGGRMSLRNMTVQYVGDTLYLPPLEREVNHIIVRNEDVKNWEHFEPERTCHDVKPSLPYFKCDSCGMEDMGGTELWIQDGFYRSQKPNYCPNCGAKVVSE